MKRFFIFAAMLLTLTLKANVEPDFPPLILPGTDDYVMTPTNMHDIDRSIARCIYTYIPESGTIDFYCDGIGNAEFYLVDQSGCTIDHVRFNSNMTHHITLQLPDSSGIYYINLWSDTHYGEAMLIIE
jgi:hypothetical protein